MFFSQNPGKSALMIMVNVKSVIFFGKSEKNIWVLDFFNYNHWYRISKTVKQMEQYYSQNSRPDIIAKHLEQYNSITLGTVQQHNRYNSYHSYSTYNVNQSNSKTANHLERYHSKTVITD